MKRARQIKALPGGKKVKVENNGILNPHFPPSSPDVSCQLLIFSVYGSDFLFSQFVKIYSIPEVAVDIMKYANFSDKVVHFI